MGLQGVADAQHILSPGRARPYVKEAPMTTMTPPTAAQTGAEAERRIAGRYVRLEQLGAGGMGTVHRARDEVTGRLVAFKQLVSSLAGGRHRTAEALFE